MPRWYKSIQAMQDDLGGQYTTAAVRGEGAHREYCPVKHLTELPRNKKTARHVAVLRSIGYEIAVAPRTRKD